MAGRTHRRHQRHDDLPDVPIPPASRLLCCHVAYFNLTTHGQQAYAVRHTCRCIWEGAAVLTAFRRSPTCRASRALAQAESTTLEGAARIPGPGGGGGLGAAGSKVQLP